MSHSVRPARSGDERRLFELVSELARFEKLEHQLRGSATELADALFGPHPSAEALVAEQAGQIVGYALFFSTFSSFLTRPGVWLEDLFVTQAERGRGIGQSLLRAVAELACKRKAARFEWAVLDWNSPAIDFYRARGITVLPDWRICRASDGALTKLASG